MYARTNSLEAKASASMLPNNLAVNLNADTGDADLLFLHKSAVHLVFSGDESQQSESGGGYLHRSVVCKIPSVSQQTSLSYILILQVITLRNVWLHLLL